MRRVIASTSAAFAIALSMLVVSSALAFRPPTKSERTAILRAAPGNPYPSGEARRTIRVSTVSARWAAVYITATRGHRDRVQSDVASMFHTKHHGWVVHEEGNGGGCGVPRPVVRDLGLACY